MLGLHTEVDDSDSSQFLHANSTNNNDYALLFVNI